MSVKQSVDDLHIFGGKPRFTQPLHVGRPNRPDKAVFMQHADDIWESAWLTNNGPKVQAFEAALCQILGVKHAIPVCNATIGLQIAIRALGMRGEVIVPSFTFIATAHSLEWQGITPVFCDVDPVTHCMDSQKIEQLITSRTTGIMPVHVWGNVCNVEAIEAIAKKHTLKILYDAAHAFGCDHKGKMVGGFGDAEVFSFHATKVLNTFEGGCITTNNDEVARVIRLMINFGFVGKDQVTHIGSNGKMSEISAAMGLASLEAFDGFVAHNRRNYQHYRRRIAEIPSLSLVEYNETGKHNFHYIIVKVAEGAGISRDNIVQVLEAENVLARRYFYPGCHRMEPYCSYYPNAGLLLPESEKLTGALLCLPNGKATTAEEIDGVCELLDFVIKNQQNIVRRLDK
ncbi:MAG: DegT/DnrJ/EryC1/StrS family aminotransferase [Cellvibrionales bacterium]|nr:DegT/DnrJ/EryC1/StrS family aminotransferase [Cellvibrionales bacterium]